MPFEPGEPVLEVLKRLRSLGGTYTGTALRKQYREHDRALIVTDEQAASYDPVGPTEPVPAGIPLSTWNLAGYRPAHAPTGKHRHTSGGLSDAAFRMAGLVETRREAAWPWTMEPDRTEVRLSGRGLAPLPDRAVSVAADRIQGC